jgi:3-deoxy-D-manno-octulosonic-acid transferase
VSTTTEAGNRLARERLPGCAVFYFPLDFAFAVRRYLRLLTPEMVILIESELWPRLIMECASSGIPVAVANARISDRSFPRYLALKALWQPILAKVGVFLAQSEETAVRLRAIGAPRMNLAVELTGNLKYDSRPARETPLIIALRTRLEREAELVVCGSTLEGEEAMLLDAWDSVFKASPRAVLVLAPRHPARFDEVALLVKQRGLPLVRASSFARVKVAVKTGSVFLLDTIGDLASAYSLAEVAFIGGSLVHAGGHNPLEPARFGVPVVMGSSFENFREIVETMRAAGGIRIVSQEELAKVLISLLRNRDEARAMGDRGRAVSAAQSGAASRSASALVRLLPVRPELRRPANGTVPR